MAEALVVGPLLNLSFFLGKHLWKRYHGRKDDIEYDHESGELLKAVESLAQFAQEKASEIQLINIQLGISPYTLGLHSVTKVSDFIENLKWEIWAACEDAEKTLNNKKLKAFVKMQRIQGIHNRLTQLLLLHLGVGMMEAQILSISN
jgi:hypothetical protein